MTTQTTQQKAQQSKSRVFVSRAIRTGDYGDGPSYCAFTVDEALISRLRELAALCEQHKLCSVVYANCPDIWGPIGIEEQERLQDPEMVVTRHGLVYFQDMPKFSSDMFKSTMVSIDALGKALEDDASSVVFDDDEAKQAYLSDNQTPALLRYAVGDWTHLFGVGQKETRCRIAVDISSGTLVAAQEWTGLKFEDIRAGRLKDLAESVIDANEVHKNPEDLGNMELTDDLPDWAAAIAAA